MSESVIITWSSSKVANLYILSKLNFSFSISKNTSLLLEITVSLRLPSSKSVVPALLVIKFTPELPKKLLLKVYLDILLIASEPKTPPALLSYIPPIHINLTFLLSLKRVELLAC